MLPIDDLLQINYQDLEDRFDGAADNNANGDGFPWDWRSSLYFPFGIEMLDRLLGGIKKRQLMLIIGEPESGTTSLALNIMANAAMSDKSPNQSGIVAMFSGQHAEPELSMRLLSIASGVSMEKMRQGKLDADHWRSLADTMVSLRSSNIRMMHSPHLTTDSITSACRDSDHALLILDRVDLLASSAPEDQREDERAAACAQMRQLANALPAPVLLTATMPPQDNGITSASMRQWSNALYDNVDTIIAITRQGEQATLRIIKDNIWPATPMQIMFDSACMQFIDLPDTDINQSGD